MRLNLKDIIHTPGASLSVLVFQLDLSDLEFSGALSRCRSRSAWRARCGIWRVRWCWSGRPRTTLDLVCDRVRKAIYPGEDRALRDCCWQRSWRTRTTTRSCCWRTDEVDAGRAGHHGVCPRNGYQEPCARRTARALCPGCGADLNRRPLLPVASEVDPRLAVLAKLLENRRERVNRSTCPSHWQPRRCHRWQSLRVKYPSSAANKRRSSVWKLEAPGLSQVPQVRRVPPAPPACASPA